MSCAIGPTCSMHHGSAVLQCEQFVSKELAHHHVKPKVAKPHPTEFVGLCNLCEFVNKCTLQKPDDGVWNCEEYQFVG